MVSAKFFHFRLFPSAIVFFFINKSVVHNRYGDPVFFTPRCTSIEVNLPFFFCPTGYRGKPLFFVREIDMQNTHCYFEDQDPFIADGHKLFSPSWIKSYLVHIINGGNAALQTWLTLFRQK